MSHALYTTRLYWAGPRGGIAKLHGRVIDLHAPPRFSGGVIVGVDYIPEITLRQIQPVCEAWRDMTDEETREADALLRAAFTPGLL